ncbi:Envelope glycoprotein gp160 [Exophiala oligosperma]
MSATATSGSSTPVTPQATPSDTANCTLDTCPLDSSFYMYRINLVPNVAFLAFFSCSLLAFICVYALTRRWFSFLVAMALGTVCEIIGYMGRILSHHNQWEENYFLIQIICLTIGPAFFSAGIYLCLSHIVGLFGPEHSRIPATWYPKMATGGAIAAIALGDGTSLDTGDNIMIAGLSFQVLTLLIFIVICVDFGFRVWKGQKVGKEAHSEPTTKPPTVSWQVKGFLAAVALSTFTIFWRCTYRVAELSRGWTGPITRRQDLFVWFEGFLISIAVAALEVFHPSLCLRENGTD